jgi:hypothetical protein
VLLINARGWLLPWKFQSTRFPNYETSWYFVYRHVGRGGASPFWFGEYPELTGLISGALFLAGMGVLLWRESRRERVRPFALGFGVLLIFLLTAKVYSPQYALWLLPFFALVRIPWYGYAAFAATDAAVWTAISGYFLAVDHARGSPETLLNLLEAAVILRYLVLGWLLWYSRRADENVAYAAA